MSAPPPFPPSSFEGPPSGAPPSSHGAAPPPKKGLSGCAIAAIVLGVAGVIGLALLGILAAIAIPQYQDYIVRTQVSATVREASELQIGVDRHVAEYEVCPDADAFASIAENAFSSVTADPMQILTGDGTLSGRWEWRESLADGHCVFDAVFVKPGHAIDGTTLEFRQDGAGGWACDGGTLPAVYRRLTCASTPTSPAVAE